MTTFTHPYFAPLAQRTIIWQFSRREVLAKYRGSLLGLGWTVATPLVMLLVYTFVFQVVLQARWGTQGASGVDFALNMYAGLIVYGLFAEVVQRAPRLVLDQPNLVKKVVFPLEVLPWVASFAAFFHFGVNLLILLAATWWLHGTLQATIVAAPLTILPLLPLMLGLGWLLASLGVYLRDIGLVVGLLLNVLLFLSPVFYPLESLPPGFRSWMEANPLTGVIEQTRRVLLLGQWPDAAVLAQQLLGGALFAIVGAWWFARTRRGFADVL